MQAKKLVSICIPSYNASRFIGETIKSVLDSTYNNLEIIVNDDASTDNTREIVEAFDDERVRFYQNDTTMGVPGNWNKALEKASGEFVGLLNHDDMYGPFWLSFSVDVFEKHPHIGWVATAFHIIDADGKRLNNVSRFAKTGGISREEAFLCTGKLDGLGPGFIARRKILEEVRYYDENAGPSADNDLFIRLAARFPLLYSINPHHTAWRLHVDNLTHQYGMVEQLTNGLYILRKIFNDDALPRDLRKKKRRFYANFYQNVLMRLQGLLANGDIETAKRLIYILDIDDYGIWRETMPGAIGRLFHTQQPN